MTVKNSVRITDHELKNKTTQQIEPASALKLFLTSNAKSYRSLKVNIPTIWKPKVASSSSQGHLP